MWQPLGMVEIMRVDVDGAAGVLVSGWPEDLTAEERASLEEGAADIQARRTVSSEEMLAKIRALPEHAHAAE